MEVRGRSCRAAWLLVVAICTPLGCEMAPREMPVSDVTGRRARIIAERRLAQMQPSNDKPAVHAVPSRMIGPTDTQPAGNFSEIEQQIPDPLHVLPALRTEPEGNAMPPKTDEEIWRQRRENYYRQVIGRVNLIRRPTAVELSLAEAIRRTLKNSYSIETQCYNPAIETTKIVEAEAQFDAVFFANFDYSKKDQPTGTVPPAQDSETRSYQGGIRKLLSTGMQVEASYQITRSWTRLYTSTLGVLNPSYLNQFSVTFRQPLLRGFGIDYNQSQIANARLERDKSFQALLRSIRETLFNVEQAYWRLFEARRIVAVDARVLSSLERILDSFVQREKAGFDVYHAQVSQIKSQFEIEQAQFVRNQNDVKNAEDALKVLMNDPRLNQAADIEIIPTDLPTLTPMVVDQLGELTAALENRQELHEAKIAIEQAQIGIGVAKNQALPKLDLQFRYIIDGLGANPDQAFKKLTDNDFTEWDFALQFEWPIGDRGPEAVLRRARYQQAQAIAANKDAIEQVITQVNKAIRDLQTNYDQIGPSVRGAQASEEQLRATIIRAQNLNAPELQVELQAYENLAQQRRTLANVLASYNIALVDLERQKGTLLEYNNVVIRGTNEDGYLAPYRAAGP